MPDFIVNENSEQTYVVYSYSGTPTLPAADFIYTLGFNAPVGSRLLFISSFRCIAITDDAGNAWNVSQFFVGIASPVYSLIVTNALTAGQKIYFTIDTDEAVYLLRSNTSPGLGRIYRKDDFTVACLCISNYLELSPTINPPPEINYTGYESDLTYPTKNVKCTGTTHLYDGLHYLQAYFRSKRSLSLDEITFISTSTSIQSPPIGIAASIPYFSDTLALVHEAYYWAIHKYLIDAAGVAAYSEDIRDVRICYYIPSGISKRISIDLPAHNTFENFWKTLTRVRNKVAILDIGSDKSIFQAVIRARSSNDGETIVLERRGIDSNLTLLESLTVDDSLDGVLISTPWRFYPQLTFIERTNQILLMYLKATFDEEDELYTDEMVRILFSGNFLRGDKLPVIGNSQFNLVLPVFLFLNKLDSRPAILYLIYLADGQWSSYVETIDVDGSLAITPRFETGMYGLAEFGYLVELSNGTILFEFTALNGDRQIYRADNLSLLTGEADWVLASLL